MQALGIALVLLVIGLLWVAAVLFGRDSRDGNDWFRRTSDATGDRDGLFHGGH
jgi:hypothetical protein